MCMDQSTIAEGIGGVTWGVDNGGNPGIVNVRSKYIQGASGTFDASPAAVTLGLGWLAVPNTLAGNGVVLPSGSSSTLRRYQIQLATGLFTQEKLVSSILNLDSYQVHGFSVGY